MWDQRNVIVALTKILNATRDLHEDKLHRCPPINATFISTPLIPVQFHFHPHPSSQKFVSIPGYRAASNWQNKDRSDVMEKHLNLISSKWVY